MMNMSEYEKIVAEQKARIVELEALVKYYEEQFKLSKSRQFGSSSEKSSPSEQLGLFDEAENTANPSIPEPELEEVTYTRRKRKGKRADDLSGLPVEVVEHTLPEEERVCGECGGDLHVMGQDSRLELKIIPAQVMVVEHKHSTYSCRGCEKANDHVPIIKAPTPEPVLKGSLASPSAVAHIMTQKYVMHAPLYRQEQDWLRQGISLSRQTMSNWVIHSAETWLAPLYHRMRILLLQREVLHADETTVQVLNEPGKAATSKSVMWLYRTSGDTKRHIILYEYQPSREQVHLHRFLKDFRGLLHADGYAGYHRLPPEITVVGCWVHCKRKWNEALKVMSPEARPGSTAQEALKRIGYLFHLEDRWKNLEPEERHRLRLEESKPLAEAFFAWLETLPLIPKSAVGKAIRYALEQKRWLMNVYRDGRSELSNNRIENSVRPFAIGRKNWLFCNTVKGATASSVIYSIIETAKANGLKPYEYLEYLLETLPNTTSSVDTLLPWSEAIPARCRLSVLEVASHD
jgi:transposase